MYDEYEEEYLQDEPAIEMTPSDEKSQSTMQNQEFGMRKDEEGNGGDSLPLCYASFELIRHIIKASKKKQKETGVVQDGNLYKNGGGCIGL